MLAIDRFILRVGRRRRTLVTARHRPTRRASTCRTTRIRAALPAVCGIGIAAVSGWLVAGSDLPSIPAVFGQLAPATTESSAGGAPVRIDSTPSGAAVRVDGASRGTTPLDIQLEPGRYSLSLERPDSLTEQETIEVAQRGASVHVDLWQHQPEVVRVRPVYPGASLVDARFLNDGLLALTVGIPTQVGTSDPSTELWRLDPATGQLTQVNVPDLVARPTVLALAPDDDHVAYVVPGSSSTTTATGWSTTAESSVSSTAGASRPESVWVASLDGAQLPQHVFDLPSGVGPSLVSSSPERIVQLIWTPDESRLVAITRQPGPPLRARIFLINLADQLEPDAESQPDALALLPAEVLTNSVAVDPTGRWAALITHASVAPGGNDLLNACVLELTPGGGFRDLADLGTLDRAPTTAPFAWAPSTPSDPPRLVVVSPAPSSNPASNGLFGIFGALGPAPPPLGLFLVDVEASGLQESQPRRLGSVTGVVGPVWRSSSTLFGFARQGDGTFSLRSIDPSSGALGDPGVSLPASTGQGAGVAVRWDVVHGYALLLSRPSAAFASASAPLQAWLVSFAPNRNGKG